MRRIRKRDERGRFVARGVSPRTRSRPLLGKSEDCGEERPGIEEKQLSFAQPTAVQQTYRLPFDDGESEQWEDVDEEIDARRTGGAQPEWDHSEFRRRSSNLSSLFRATRSRRGLPRRPSSPQGNVGGQAQQGRRGGQMAAQIKFLQPPAFAGKENEDVGDWMYKFERIGRYNRWGDDEL